MTDAPPVTSHVDRALTVAGKVRGTGGKLHERTMIKYQRAMAEFEAMCRDLRISVHVQGHTSETLAVYVEYLLQRGYATSTIQGRLTGVKAIHRVRGWPVPDGVPAWYVLRASDDTADGAKVKNPGGWRAVVPYEVLARAVGVCDTSTAAGCRDAALATLAFAVLAKLPDLAGMDIGHIVPVGEWEQGIEVVVDGGRIAVAHDHEVPDVCAVCAVRRWIGVLAQHGARQGALFRRIDASGNIGGCEPVAGRVPPGARLTVRSVSLIWTKLCVRAKLPHSTPLALRLGGAAHELRQGEQLAEVMRKGRWSPHSGTVAQRLMDATTNRRGGPQ